MARGPKSKNKKGKKKIASKKFSVEKSESEKDLPKQTKPQSLNPEMDSEEENHEAMEDMMQENVINDFDDDELNDYDYESDDDMNTQENGDEELEQEDSETLAGPEYMPNYRSSRDILNSFMNQFHLEYGKHGHHVELKPGNLGEVTDIPIAIDITSSLQNRKQVDFVRKQFPEHFLNQIRTRKVGMVREEIDYINGRQVYYMIVRQSLNISTNMRMLSFCFRNLKQFLIEKNIKHVALPLIGANKTDGIIFPKIAKLVNAIFDGTDIMLTFHLNEFIMDPPRIPGRLRFPMTDVDREGYPGPSLETVKRMKYGRRKAKKVLLGKQNDPSKKQMLEL
eukprot:gb/GECH01004614.1/.p1 GENE.gb/GECH01004614.1/~~gb/GECH01004614.1/.p1  ORF type:complete len:337 (+),score=86.03 gb/GECH01004614.1/:1-1011(+)